MSVNGFGPHQLPDAPPTLPSILSSPPLPTPGAGTSGPFSVSLDPIAEATSPVPTSPGPVFPSPVPPNTQFMGPVTRLPPMKPPSLTRSLSHNADSAQVPPTAPGSSRPHRPAHLGLGPSPLASAKPIAATNGSARANSTLSVPPVPRTAFSSTFAQPQTEVILYAYAQLTGTLMLLPLAPPPGVPPSFGPSPAELSRNLALVRRRLRKPKVVGGGSMDLSLSFQPQPPRPGPRRKPSHGRSSSSLLGMLSPTNLLGVVSPAPSPRVPGAWTPTHRARVRSMSAQAPGTSLTAPPSPTAGGALGLGIGLGLGFGASTPELAHGRFPEEDEEDDPGAPLPTFEVPPSLLAVDLALAPGEVRSCEFFGPDAPTLPLVRFERLAIFTRESFTNGVLTRCPSHRHVHAYAARQHPAHLQWAHPRVRIPVRRGDVPRGPDIRAGHKARHAKFARRRRAREQSGDEGAHQGVQPCRRSVAFTSLSSPNLEF